MPTKIDRYILRKFFSTFFFCMLLFTIIAVAVDSSEHTDDFVKSKLSTSEIIKQYYVGFVPWIWGLLYPLFVFIAVIFFTSKMALRSEVVSIIASGATYNRWLRPYFIAGLIFAVGLWFAIRAFHYFHLTVWYGDVPLVDKVLTVEESQNLTRNSQSDIVNFINADLDFAASTLPVNTGYDQADRGRITKGAALALKARLALYLSNWQEAATITDQIINGEAGSYGLFNSYSGLFHPANEYNQEVILDLQYVPVQRTYQEQRFFIPKTEGKLVTSIAPTQELVDSYRMINGLAISDPASGYDPANPYTNRDPRFESTIVYDGYQWKRPDGSIFEIRTLPGLGDNSIDRDDASPTGYYFAKYYDPTADTDNRAGLNLILIRYAEVLLMNAEAKLELGQMTAEVWNQTVRTIRERAGFTEGAALEFDGTLDQAGLREVIRNERRVEFALEGLRIFDIRRWKTAEVVLNGWAHGIKVGDPGVDNGFKRVDLRAFDPAKHYLWPIPQRERDLNKNLTQNPGW